MLQVPGAQRADEVELLTKAGKIFRSVRLIDGQQIDALALLLAQCAQQQLQRLGAAKQKGRLAGGELGEELVLVPPRHVDGGNVALSETLNLIGDNALERLDDGQYLAVSKTLGVNLKRHTLAVRGRQQDDNVAPIFCAHELHDLILRQPNDGDVGIVRLHDFQNIRLENAHITGVLVERTTDELPERPGCRVRRVGRDGRHHGRLLGSLLDRGSDNDLADRVFEATLVNSFSEEMGHTRKTECNPLVESLVGLGHSFAES